MTFVPTPFSPQVLTSYANLCNFLIGPATDKRVQAEMIAYTNPPAASTKPSCFNKHPCLIKVKEILLKIQRVVKIIFYSLSLAFSYLLFAVCLKARSYQVYVKADLELASLHREQKPPTSIFRNLHLLAPSYNQYSVEAAVLPVQPTSLPPHITDTRLVALFAKPRPEFERTRGICNGASVWFILEFLKTEKVFENSLSQMRALGQLFAKGAPIEAALIQHLRIPNGDLGLQEAAPSYFLGSAKECLTLPDGTYYLSTGTHAMVYVRKGKERYFFDPNIGTLELRGATAEPLFSSILNSYRQQLKMTDPRIVKMLSIRSKYDELKKRKLHGCIHLQQRMAECEKLIASIDGELEVAIGNKVKVTRISLGP